MRKTTLIILAIICLINSLYLTVSAADDENKYEFETGYDYWTCYEKWEDKEYWIPDISEEVSYMSVFYQKYDGKYIIQLMKKIRDYDTNEYVYGQGVQASEDKTAPFYYWLIKETGITKEEFIAAQNEVLAEEGIPEDFCVFTREEIDILFSDDYELMIKTFKHEDAFYYDGRIYSEDDIRRDLSMSELVELRDNSDLIEYLEGRYARMIADTKYNEDCPGAATIYREFIDELKVATAPQTSLTAVAYVTVAIAALGVVVAKKRK